MDNNGSFTNETGNYLGATDGYLDKSTHTYQIGVDQNMTADEYRLNNTSTHIIQSYQNASTDDEMTTEQFSAVLFALLIFKWILSPLILTANSLSIIVIVKYIKNLTPTHIGIAFLAIAGLFVGIVPLFSLAFYLMGNSVHCKHIYDLMVWVTLAAHGLNISAMLLIALERYLVLSRQFHRKHLTVRRQVGLSMGFFVYFLLLDTSITLLSDSEVKNGVLVITFEHKAVLDALSILTYTVITLTVVFCYIYILKFLWKERRTLVSGQNSSNQQISQKEKKTRVLIVKILTLYLVGTSPTFVYGVLVGNNPKYLNLELLEFSRLLWCATTLVDIFICVWKVPEFQEGYRKILFCPRKPRIIQVAPRPNVQPCGSSQPLEPRR